MRAGTKDIVKRGIVLVHGPVGRRRLRRALDPAPRPLHLELGSDGRRPGWLVTNASWRARHFMDATQPWPVEPGTVDLVYADNMIEHVPLAAGRALLRQAHAALRPGGTIRLATPDVEAAARLYLGADEEAAARVMHHHRHLGRVAEHPVDLLRVPFTEFGHHLGYLYDEASLAAELKRAGFHGVRRCATRESAHPQLQGLENRTDEESLVQLILEADA